MAADLDSVRGIEGDAAKIYFSALNCVVQRDAREKFDDGWSHASTATRPLQRTAFVSSIPC